MSNELKRTYVPFKAWKEKSKQIEYTEKTPLLSSDGKLLAKGWARRNVFEYNRNFVKKGIISRKEWDFYTIHIGDEMQVLISFVVIKYLVSSPLKGKTVVIFSRPSIISIEALTSTGIPLKAPLK